MNTQLLAGRHSSVLEIAKGFAFEHLPENEYRDITKTFHDFAEKLITDCKEDSANLTTALRKLLESKDSMLRTIPTPEQDPTPAAAKSNPDAVENKVQTSQGS